ncbi:MAG: GNAT family N-acetyltransferase, partial [Candidatus Avispirillum sp.]
ILSYAGINDIYCGENSLGISVETAPEARRYGYGSAVVTALCEFIIGNGKKVLYKCSAENIASSALALKCGFELVGTRYSYVCGLK